MNKREPLTPGITDPHKDLLHAGIPMVDNSVNEIPNASAQEHSFQCPWVLDRRAEIVERFRMRPPVDNGQPQSTVGIEASAQCGCGQVHAILRLSEAI